MLRLTEYKLGQYSDYFQRAKHMPAQVPEMRVLITGETDFKDSLIEIIWLGV